VTNYGDRERPGSSITVIDLTQPEVVRTVDLGRHTRPHGVAWIDPRRVVLTTEGSRQVLVVDTASGEVVSSIPTEQEISHMIAVTPDGKRGFVANIGSGSVTAVDLERGVKLRDVTTGEGAEGIAVTPDGKQLWVVNRAADTITVIDTATLEVLDTVPCPGFPIRISVTPDGEHALISCARSGELALFDVGERKELRRSKLDLTALPGSERRLFGDRFGDSPVPVGLVIAPDGKTAWVAATQSDVVVSFDPATLGVTGLLEAGHEPDGMAYSSVER
jgi:YVTN family beta-propeller protein